MSNVFLKKTEKKQRIVKNQSSVGQSASPCNSRLSDLSDKFAETGVCSQLK